MSYISLAIIRGPCKACLSHPLDSSTMNPGGRMTNVPSFRNIRAHAAIRSRLKLFRLSLTHLVFFTLAVLPSDCETTANVDLTGQWKGTATVSGPNVENATFHASASLTQTSTALTA